MPSISSILSTLTGNLGINRNSRESHSSGNSASTRYETVTDVVNLSERALQSANQASRDETSQRAAGQYASAKPESKSPTAHPEPDDQRLIEKRQQSSRAGRVHEWGNITAGGEIGRSQATFNHQQGPAESVAKVPLTAVALPPTDPSPEYRAVAAEAARMKSDASRNLHHQESAAVTTSPSGKQASTKTHPGLASYLETSNILDQLKPPPSIRISV